MADEKNEMILYVFEKVTTVRASILVSKRSLHLQDRVLIVVSVRRCVFFLRSFCVSLVMPVPSPPCCDIAVSERPAHVGDNKGLLDRQLVG